MTDHRWLKRIWRNAKRDDFITFASLVAALAAAGLLYLLFARGGIGL